MTMKLHVDPPQKWDQEVIRAALEAIDQALGYVDAATRVMLETRDALRESMHRARRSRRDS
jgi:hypothetical protein